MKLWIALFSGDPVTGPMMIARSGALGLVRQFIDDLQTNRLLEDDADDVICDPAFPAEARRMMTQLTEQMRRNAVNSFSEMDPPCSPAQAPAPIAPGEAAPGNAGQGNTRA